MEKSLDELQAEFLANGGAVQELPITARAGTSLAIQLENPKKKLGPLTVSDTAKQAEDASLVTLIRQHKDTVTSSTQLAEKVGISASRLQRLLTKYFAGDSSVAPLMAMTRQARNEREDAVVLEKVRNLINHGVKGLYALSAGTGASTVRISKLAKQHGITIPRPDAKSVPCGVPAGMVAVPIDTLKRWALEGNQGTYKAITEWLGDLA